MKTIGIISAMQIEAETIVAAMHDVKRETVGSLSYVIGKIGENRVISAVCGIGKVFAAICAQTMIIKYAPDCIINTGIGGSLSRELSIGDIAVATSLCQHDMDTSAIGDPVGLISGINVIDLPTDPELCEKITSVANAVGAKTLLGKIASGDQFVHSAERKKFITDTFGAVVCEMEGAAIGQVCYVNHVPCAVVRAVSDNADGDSTDDYPKFAREAAERSAGIVIKLASSM